MRVKLGFLLVWLVLGGGAAARAESRFALVVGNNSYSHLDTDHQLQKAVSDANAVGDALQRDGFQVIRGANLTRSAMVDKVYDLTSKLQPGDTAFFYFAGHGVALGSGNYLLPSDVPEAAAGEETRIANQSIAEADIIASIQEKGARVSIVVLDACRDNPFKRPGLRSVGLDRGFGRMPEANGVFSLYSAGFGQSALDRLSDDDRNPNSVFTRVLVPLLNKPGLNLDDLAYEVREDVAKLAATSADHHEQVPAAYDQIVGGRVYLAGLPPEPPRQEAVGRVVGGSSGTTPTVAPAADAIAWSFVELSKDPAEIEAFITRFPGSSLRPAAEARRDELKRAQKTASLPPPPPVLPPPAVPPPQIETPPKIIPPRIARPTLLHDARPRAPKIIRLPPAVARRPPPPRPVVAPPRTAQEEVEHRTYERSYAARRAPAKHAGGGSSCFMFNGERVCE